VNGCILFHAINGIGLGHVSRLRAIALAIRELRSDLPLLFAVEGDSHGLLDSVALPYVTFPSATRFESDAEPWLKSIRGPLLGSMAAAIVDATNPRLVVFDCLPNPAFLTLARRKNVPFAICVRKTKDMDEYFGRLRPVLEQARIIIFPHDPTELEVPKEFAAKSKFVGTIVRQLTTASASTDKSGIVISGGGGGYPGTVGFYNLALEAVSKCKQKDPTLSATLVTGPLFREWNQLKLVSGVQIIPFDPEIEVRFTAASLVICQGGYNTVAELTALGVPVICVPATRRFDDQNLRARKTAETHEQFFVWENANSDAFAAFILEVLQKRSAARTGSDNSEGARLAAEFLIKAMSNE
jgi:predicted glycosyltransferase